MSSTCHSALRTWMVRTRRISPKHPRIWKHATDLEVGARGVILWAPLGYNTQRERACLRALRMLWTITPPSKLVSCHGDSFHIWKIGCTGFTKPITDWQLQAAGLKPQGGKAKAGVRTGELRLAASLIYYKAPTVNMSMIFMRQGRPGSETQWGQWTNSGQKIMRPGLPPWRWNHKERSSALAANLCRKCLEHMGGCQPSHLTLPRVPIDPTAALPNPSLLETYAVVKPTQASPSRSSPSRASRHKINLCRHWVFYYLCFCCFFAFITDKNLCQPNPDFTDIVVYNIRPRHKLNYR